MGIIYHIFLGGKFDFLIAKLFQSIFIKTPSLSNKKSVVSFSVKNLFFILKILVFIEETKIEILLLENAIIWKCSCLIIFL